MIAPLLRNDAGLVLQGLLLEMFERLSDRGLHVAGLRDADQRADS